MELITGKYISLGHSIQIRKNKNDTYTYYYNLRDKDNKVKRIKLFIKDSYNKKDFARAILESDTIDKESVNIEKENIPIQKDVITLNYLSDEYFKSRWKKKEDKLKQSYNHLSKEERDTDKLIKRRMSSVKTEQQKYNKNVRNSDLAKLDILRVNREVIKDYTENYLSEKGLGEKSTFHIISMIKTIFNYSIRNDLIDIKNPFQNIVYKNPKRKRVRYLNEKELRKLLDTCKAYQSPNVYLVVYLGVLTAARAQMILNIKKKDIDIVNRKIKLSNFKSDKYYTIGLNKESVDWLNKTILQHIDYNDYLVQPTNPQDRKSPQKPLSEIPERVYKIMDELFNKGIDKSVNDERDNVVNFHTIRRSVATNLALQKTSIYDIMTLLNHSSTKQTEDYLSLGNHSLNVETDKFFSSLFSHYSSGSTSV